MKSSGWNLLKEYIFILYLNIGTPYYQERLWYAGFDLDLVLERTYTNPYEPQIPFKISFLRVSLQNSETPGFSSECSDTMFGVLEHIPEVSRMSIGCWSKRKCWSDNMPRIILQEIGSNKIILQII